MSDTFVITGRLIAAARVLTGINPVDLANASGVSISTLAQPEAGAVHHPTPKAKARH